MILKYYKTFCSIPTTIITMQLEITRITEPNIIMIIVITTITSTRAAKFFGVKIVIRHTFTILKQLSEISKLDFCINLHDLFRIFRVSLSDFPL